MAASIRDVAELAGVSVGTVSNVLNRPGKVSASTAQRVHDAIDRLGFVRNDAARQLRLGTSSTVGLIVLDAANPFFAALARGAEDGAARHGMRVLLGNSDGDPEREQGYLALFEQQRVRGVLVSPRGDVEAALERLRSRGTPAVLVDRRDGPGRFASVSVDDVAGGELAVRHLLERGRRSIAFVGGPLALRQAADRLEGARHAVAGRSYARVEVVETAALTVFEGRAAGERLAARPPDERPDAVFAANDLLAVGVLQALVMSGRMRVPDDLALVGYDDIDFAAATVVPLTSVRQPAALMGSTAIELLLRDAAGEPPESIVFEPELVVRESSG